MVSETQRTRAAGLGGLLVVLVLALGAVWAFPRVEAHFIARAQQEGQSTLRLVADAVDQAVGRYAPMPALIASDPALPALLRSPENQGLVPFMNEKLRLAAASIGASDVYVMDASGRTVAASNYRSDTSFIGRSFEFRPYFTRALAGEAAQFHALGTTSGERGFFFAAPVLDGIEVLGVLAVKITVGDFEEAWAGSGREIIVADANGIAFMASRSDYRMRALAPLSDGTLARIADTRQFPLGSVTPIPFSADVIATGAVEVTLGAAGDGERFLAESQSLALAGWHAVVLTPLALIRSEAVRVMLIWGLVATALLLAALVVFERRARLLDRMRVEKSQRDLLEVKVRERTADLDATNASLRSEVLERRRAEDRLRKTQKELVQAGKLAALGKMSAALSHEINQPLAAVKSYADNAAQFLERERVGEAAENISRISDMTDRMAEISRHLRNFARQPGETLSAVPVSPIIEEAMALVEPHGRKIGARVAFQAPEEEIWVLGGRLRLQQVVINILNNAIDAMQGAADPVVQIAVEAREAEAVITLRDRGPGLPPEALDQVFEAFYTTKEAGAGMGLGMSISQNIVSDFGGTLGAENHPEGGAVFTITLERRDAPNQMAAQ